MAGVLTGLLSRQSLDCIFLQVTHLEEKSPEVSSSPRFPQELKGRQTWVLVRMHGTSGRFQTESGGLGVFCFAVSKHGLPGGGRNRSSSARSKLSRERGGCSLVRERHTVLRDWTLELHGSLFPPGLTP